MWQVSCVLLRSALLKSSWVANYSQQSLWCSNKIFTITAQILARDLQVLWEWRSRSQRRKCEKKIGMGEGGKIKTKRKRRERELKDGTEGWGRKEVASTKGLGWRTLVTWMWCGYIGEPDRFARDKATKNTKVSARTQARNYNFECNWLI